MFGRNAEPCIEEYDTPSALYMNPFLFTAFGIVDILPNVLGAAAKAAVDAGRIWIALDLFDLEIIFSVELSHVAFPLDLSFGLFSTSSEGFFSPTTCKGDLEAPVCFLRDIK